MGLIIPPIKDGDWRSVRQAIAKLASLKLGYDATPTFAGLDLSGLTKGSALFAGTGGLISQDNSNLFWDDTNNRLGIGTNTPATTLDITGALNITDGGILSTGTTDGYTIPSGAGTRMMWIPSKSAFRVGTIAGTQWDSGNIGNSSISFGIDGIASGLASIHFGDNGIASGGASIHFGVSGAASGDFSIHTGLNNLADVFSVLTLGRYSATTGGNLTSWVSTDPILIIGNGTGTGARSNVFILYKNGTIGATSIGAIGDVDLLSFAANALTVNGTVGSGAITSTGVSSFGSGTTIGNLTLADGSITDSGGTISFDNEDLTTTGTGSFKNVVITGDATTLQGVEIDMRTTPVTSASNVDAMEFLVTHSPSGSAAGIVTIGMEYDIVQDHDLTGGVSALQRMTGMTFALEDRGRTTANYILDAAIKNTGTEVFVTTLKTHILSGVSEENSAMELTVSESSNLDTPTKALTLTNTGMDITVRSNGLLIDAGSITRTNYGVKAAVAHTGDGTTTSYGFYAGTIQGDTAWGFYNSTAVDNFLGPDNAKTFMGTAKDGSIYYDGTNLIIDPDVVGTGGVLIGATGDDNLTAATITGSFINSSNIGGGINELLRLTYDNALGAGASISWWAEEVAESARISHSFYLDTVVKGDMIFSVYSNGLAEKMRLKGDGTLIVTGGSEIGDGTNNLIVEDDADTYWTGAGTGLPYGSLYLHEGAANVDISGAGADTYVKITGFDAGLMNEVTENSDAFNVGKVGIYKVDWQISADSQGNNLTYECDIFVNGVEQNDGSARRKFGAAADFGSFSGTAILDITNTGHDIDLRIKGVGTDVDIDIFNMNFNIVQVGGT